MNQHETFLDFGRSKFKAIESIDLEINDELDFHLACRVDELVDSGLSEEEAKRQAESDFGARADIAKQCQKINYGNRILFGRCAIGALMLSLIAIGWLGWELMAQKSANTVLIQKLAEINLAPVSPMLELVQQNGATDVHGTLTDKQGKAVPDAKVLLVVKSWPNGKFSMHALATESDSDGNFRFVEAFTKGAKTEFLVTVVADGWLMDSEYVAGHDGSPLEKFELKLAAATPQKIDVGKEHAGWNVVPKTRTSSADGKKHYVYPISKAEFDHKVNDDGTVDMNYFAPGDELRFVVSKGTNVEEVDVELPGGEQAKKVKAGTIGDISGSIIDQDGNPIAKASVILVSKLWPKGKFQMKTSRVRTDADGKFLFSERFKKGDKCQFNVTVAEEGWALDSQYLKNPNGDALDPVEFKLQKAVQKTFAVKLADGSPAKNVNVYPRGCTRSDGRQVFLYPVSAKYVKAKADAEGKVTMSLFAKGDTFNLNFSQSKLEGEVSVEVDGEEIQSVTVE